MKRFAFVIALLFSGLPVAGTYEKALIRGDSTSVIKMIDRGVDVNTVDRDGNSLLTQVVRNDLPELFDYLLQKRVRFNTATGMAKRC